MPAVHTSVRTMLLELDEKGTKGSVHLTLLPAELHTSGPSKEAGLRRFDSRFRQTADGKCEA